MFPNASSLEKKQANVRSLQRKENQGAAHQNRDYQPPRVNIWRPWVETQDRSPRFQPYSTHLNRDYASRQSLLSTFKHPVRLYWTKKAYDYMYEAGETLLRNFPVQATIQIVEDTDSEDSEDEDEELYGEEDKNEEK